MKGWWSAGGSPAKVNALKARGLISHWPPRRRFTARRYIYVSHMYARSKEAYCVLIFSFNWFLKKAILVWSCTIIAIFKDFWNKLALSSYGDTKWHCEETLKNTLIPFASLSLFPSSIYFAEYFFAYSKRIFLYYHCPFFLFRSSL